MLLFFLNTKNGRSFPLSSIHHHYLEIFILKYTYVSRFEGKINAHTNFFKNGTSGTKTIANGLDTASTVFNLNFKETVSRDF
jgi:hypothetical protein